VLSLHAMIGSRMSLAEQLDAATAAAAAAAAL
jgi:hypothetical protein